MSFRIISRSWFQIFLGGSVLFLATEQALKYTTNPNLIPTVIMLGAFTVPVAFVAYFYGQEHIMDRLVHKELPMTLVMASLLIGGALGVLVAGLLEYQTLRNLGPVALLGVGVIEEAAKLIFPVALYIHGRYRSEIDGILFGVASGMGFAALETMGYGLVAFMKSNGNVSSIEEVMLVRGLLSPAGHAAWTGLVCGVLWRQRQLTGKMFHTGVIGVYLLAVALHVLWDLTASVNLVFINFPGFIIIGGVSLTVLILRLREARRISSQPEDDTVSRLT